MVIQLAQMLGIISADIDVHMTFVQNIKAPGQGAVTLTVMHISFLKSLQCRLG